MHSQTQYFDEIIEHAASLRHGSQHYDKLTPGVLHDYLQDVQLNVQHSNRRSATSRTDFQNAPIRFKRPAQERDAELSSGVRQTVFGAVPTVSRQWQTALTDVVDLVLVEDHGRVFTRLAHHVKEQVGDALIDGCLLVGSGPVRARRRAFPGHQDVYDWHRELQGSEGSALGALL